jgi:hypothetical protein
MKFSKFNRRRNVDPLRKYRISQAKTEYLNSRGKSRILDSSLFPENRTWGALHKAWKGYIIAKNLCETQRARYYARVIQKLQNELGLPVSSFPELDIYPLEGEGYSQDEINQYYEVEYISNQDMKEWYL